MATTAGVTNWKNVNNWHWVEKNCLPWAKSYITSKVVGLEYVANDGTTLKVSEVADISGDVHVNQRKGKIITIYDMQLDLRWKAEKADGTIIGGKAHCGEFEHDSGPEDIVFQVSSESSDTGVIAQVKSHLIPLIRSGLSKFSEDLKDEHSKDVYIPPEEMKGHPVGTPYHPKPPVASAVVTPTPKKSANVVGALGTIKQTVEFVASANDIYETLLDPQRASIWSRSRAEIGKAIGSNFSLFGGNITGRILELEPAKKIVQTWRLRSWPSDHYSTVTIVFEEGRESTTLKLTQTDVPVGEKDITETNWQNYYWNGIKGAFGYGSLL